jgi:glutathione synthase
VQGGRRLSVLAVLDPHHGPDGFYNFKKDSSHLLLHTLSKRGHRVFYADPSLIFLKNSDVCARTATVSVLEKEPYFIFPEEGEEVVPLKKFDLILMRKDPPVDQAYLYCTQLLSLVSEKVLIVNDPKALREWNEKMAIFQFPKWIPPTLVASDEREIAQFIRSQGGTVIMKPLDSFEERGTKKITSASEAEAGKMTMFQALLPDALEKRIFMIDGKPMGAIFRKSLSATTLSAKEKRICADISPFLKKNRIFFAGVDIIGEKLTEINITSPGLLWEWSEIDNRRYEEEIVTILERKLRKK